MPNFIAIMGSVVQRSASPGDWYGFIPPSTYNNSDGAIISAVNSGVTHNVEVWETPPPNFNTSGGGTALIEFGIDKTQINLNGTLYDFFSLPSGLRILTANLVLSTNGQDGSTDILLDGTSILNIPVDTGTDVNVALTFGIGPPFSPVDVFNASYGASFVTISGWQPPTTAFIFPTSPNASVMITGTYDIVVSSFSFQVKDANKPAVAGDTVTVVSPGPQDPDHPFDFNDLTSLDIVSADGLTTINIPVFTVVAPGILEFPWPDPSPSGDPVFNIVGTTFSGSVLLGQKITIFFTNASGIYQLVPGKTSDTLYNVVDKTTVELAIPEPFVKTAYIGG